jgi:hypothetical protein
MVAGRDDRPAVDRDSVVSEAAVIVLIGVVVVVIALVAVFLP